MEKLEEFSIMDVIECFDSIKMSKKLDIDTEELQEMVTWLKVYRNEFDCQKVNQDLLQYWRAKKFWGSWANNAVK
ncbi:hypothetical protein CAL7102_00885 [Dulcicalothrix desertica PCC 7102]|nr:hypothetical protein CAL7102_00885 [Dulcicalothrix desertica PCC 7102]